MVDTQVPKRIVVCCDGTWYASDQDDTLPSNVARMSRSIAKVGTDEKGRPVPQISFYQAGVGTGSQSPVSKAYQAAFGVGLTQLVAEAYNIIACNWAPGDEIFLFGFSRGAFTARAIAGLICDVGLLDPTALEFFDDMYTAYQTKGDLSLEETSWAKSKYSKASGRERGVTMWDAFQYNLQKDVVIKCVGVWDTVGSLGLPNSWVTELFRLNRKHKFHDTSLHPQVQNGFHAISLDERRGNFAPTMWYLDDANTTTKLRQCWFPGYHADVGGGTVAGLIDRSEIDEITFAWMCDQVRGFIQLNPKAVDKIVLSRLPNLPLVRSFQSDLDKYEMMATKIEWAKGTIVDPFSLAYRIAGGEFVRRPGETTMTYSDGKPIPRENFHEEIHPSVIHRIRNQVGYKPKALAESAGWRFNEGEDGKGRRWTKVTGGREMFSIPEYVTPKSGEADGIPVLERLMAPADLLQKIDAAASRT